jgi:hypothetical protein
MIKLCCFLLFSTALISCTNTTSDSKNKPVARVLDHYLYQSDLAGVVPSGISAADSSTITSDFIEKWVRNQLMLNKAELNLTDQEKNVEQQIDNYRSSLLIFAYEESYLRQNLDTVISDKEVEEYYNENKVSFILGNSLMKGLFIKLPASSPQLYKVRQWIRSDDPQSIKNLEGYCFKFATVYDDFNNDWVKLDDLLGLMPTGSRLLESSILSLKFYETFDNTHVYFLGAKEIMASGTITPLQIVKKDISNILINKRKIKLINELESSIYSDAQNREHFNIYQ